MQLGHKLRYLAEWIYTITCGFLLFCDTLYIVLLPLVYSILFSIRTEMISTIMKELYINCTI